LHKKFASGANESTIARPDGTKGRILSPKFRFPPGRETTVQVCPNETILSQIRRGVARDLVDMYGLTDDQARVAESISYLYIYCGHLIESMDTPDEIPVRAGLLQRVAREEGVPVPGRGSSNVPSTEMFGKIGSQDFRDFCNPLAKARSKLKPQEPVGSKHEGWGAFKDWMSAKITEAERKSNKREIDDVARELTKMYPDKIGNSFFESSSRKDEVTGRDIPLIEDLLLGNPVSFSGENPFGGYYIQLSKLKGIGEVFLSSSKVDPSKPGLAGEDVGKDVNTLLQGINRNHYNSNPNDRFLAEQMVLAKFHEATFKDLRVGATNMSSISRGIFLDGVKGSLGFRPKL
ncbi:MAG: hypothetical protein Q8Q15_01925, partial [bacterium]|nr:hypothetical protein [bacterium]